MKTTRVFKRLIVSYLSYIGIYLLFIIFIPFPTLHFLPTNIDNFFVQTTIFIILFSPVIYLLWRNIFITLLIAFSAAGLYFYFSLLFLFTMFFWPIVGGISLIYAHKTGLFDKNQMTFKEVKSLEPKKPFWWMKPLIKTFLIVVFLFVLLSLTSYTGG